MEDKRRTLLEVLGPGKSLTLDGVEYHIEKVIGKGSNCIAYKAKTTNGPFVCIREYYPMDLANAGAILPRVDSPDLYLNPELPDFPDEIQERAEFAKSHPFAQEDQASDSLQYIYTQKDKSGNNDPHYFHSRRADWSGNGEAINQYRITDTHNGETLDEITPYGEGKERVIDILQTTKRILEAVQYLHAGKPELDGSSSGHKCFLHLDLKPENIFISSIAIGDPKYIGNRFAILIDFGSSFEIGDDGHLVTDDSLFFSWSSDYAAPEVSNLEMDSEDTSEIGTWSDVYSVVMIMQEKLLMDVPAEIMEELQRKDTRSCDMLTYSESINTLLPAEQDIVCNLVRYGIEERYKTAAEMMKAIDKTIKALNNNGITPEVILINAQKLAMRDDFAGYIIRDLLPSVSYPSDQASADAYPASDYTTRK